MTPSVPRAPIAKFRRDDEGPLAAELHSRDTFVPALDHHAHAEARPERLAAIDRAVEFLDFVSVPLLQPAGVMPAFAALFGENLAMCRDPIFAEKAGGRA
jgi:hypothetical protein